MQSISNLLQINIIIGIIQLSLERMQIRAVWEEKHFSNFVYDNVRRIISYYITTCQLIYVP